jgi:hypothetical protein
LVKSVVLAVDRFHRQVAFRLRPWVST